MCKYIAVKNNNGGQPVIVAADEKLEGILNKAESHVAQGGPLVGVYELVRKGVAVTKTEWTDPSPGEGS